MRFLLFLSFIFFLFLIQIGILPHFLIFGFSIDILLISAFIFSFFISDYQELMTYSFVAGLLLDVYSGVPFGIILLSFVLSVVLVNFSVYNLLGRENILVVCIGVAGGFLAYFVIYFSLLKAYGSFRIFPEMPVGIALFSKVAIFSIILNAFGAVVLYAPFKKIIRFADNFKR